MFNLFSIYNCNCFTLGRFKRMFLLGLGLLLVYPSLLLAENNDLEQAQVLVDKLRQGGYVLYMRHAASDRSQTDRDTANFSDCTQQRNLSAKGRQQARDIGNAFKVLKIPVGKVITSPYCRCVDTAQLAFGQGEKLKDLRFTLSEGEAETQRLKMALKAMLSQLPAKETNSIVVAHTGNLKEAANIWPKPEGVLHVFKPLGVNGFEHLGSISPKQWRLLK